MISFNDLLKNIDSKTKIDDYLKDFFTRKNFKEYQIDEDAKPSQVKAIRIMFESRKDISKRIDDAFDYDPFCAEALFAYLMTAEDVFLQLRFNAYYDEASKYGSFDTYQKKCYIRILNFYVDFLLDICNVTKAIVVQKLIIKLTNNCSNVASCRLAYCYYGIEDADSFYRLYTETNLGAYEYILLLITLLKHDEEIRAQEVLLDMFKNIEYSSYIDHVWDLDENDPVQKEFADTVEDCFEDISSIPTFFSWVNRVREKNGK